MALVIEKDDKVLTSSAPSLTTIDPCAMDQQAPDERARLRREQVKRNTQAWRLRKQEGTAQQTGEEQRAAAQKCRVANTAKQKARRDRLKLAKAQQAGGQTMTPQLALSPPAIVPSSMPTPEVAAISSPFEHAFIEHGYGRPPVSPGVGFSNMRITSPKAAARPFTIEPIGSPVPQSPLSSSPTASRASSTAGFWSPGSHSRPPTSYTDPSSVSSPTLHVAGPISVSRTVPMPTTLSQYLAVNAGTLCERGCARVRAIVYKGTRNPLCDACLRTKDVWPCTMPTVEFTKHPDPLRPLYFQWHARRLNSYPTNRYLAALLPSHGAVLEHCFRIHNGFVDELIAWQGRWWTAHITDTESETFEAGLKV